MRSADLETMLAALDEATHPLDRHFLFERIIRETFRHRKIDHRMRDLCQQTCLQHLKEFAQISGPLKTEIGYGTMPYVATFHCLATLLTEWGAYERAIAVYETALSYGIDDKSEGGFQGKIVGLRLLLK